MQLEHDPIKLTIAKFLAEILAPMASDNSHSEQNYSQSDLYKSLTAPPQKEWGHYAFPCFMLAKVLRKNPAQVAKDLEQIYLQQKESGTFHYSLVTQVQARGPYLNFFLSSSLMAGQILPFILNGQFFQRPLTHHTPKTMIEYSQPNTHKEFHVGHMRNLSLGHSLVLLHRYCGYEILSATFPGDLGTHVAKCLWYLKNYHQGPIPDHRKGAFLGRMYTMAHLKLENEKGTPQEVQNQKELSSVLAQIEDKKGEYYQLWKETREWSIQMMKDIYQWTGVEFDFWYFESDVDAASIELAKKYYQQGIFVQSEGAIGADLSADGLGFCLLIKSDGHGLYATKDLELARRKFEDNHIEKSIYVVDVRQSHHFAQVFKTLEKVGFPHAKDCLHLSYDFVELPDGIMSSRKGNIIPIEDLIEQMVLLIKKEYLIRYQNEWTDNEIDQVANVVAKGAIKYGMLRIDPQRKIIFDMKEWLKLDGESGPYLQYVGARISSLCQKMGTDLNFDKLNHTANSSLLTFDLLTHPGEEDLIFRLSRFNEVVLSSCEQFKPAHLCSFLYDLGKAFNYFYAECPIGQASSLALKEQRLALAKATGLIIREGLKLLGIQTPRRM